VAQALNNLLPLSLSDETVTVVASAENDGYTITFNSDRGK